MNEKCETCRLDIYCGYEHKPTECVNKRKFKNKDSKDKELLISSASEMLYVLVDLLKNYECGAEVDKKLIKIIEKATGRKP